jgi:RNA polymerase sigma-70 factor (ECF subfamily)
MSLLLVYSVMMGNNSTTEDMRIDRAIAGDDSAMLELFEEHRDRLKRMLELRMDRRLKRRIDASDVLQEAYLDLAKQLPGYAAKPTIPFFVWLRRITGQRLAMLHRHHIGAAKRTAAMEVGIFNGVPEASSVHLATQLVGELTTVTEAALRNERQLKLMEVLNELDADDREIVALRHFERMSIGEIAAQFEISESAAGMRHLRALRKLKKLLTQYPEHFDSLAGFGGEG